MSKPSVSIIIVNWKTPILLARCLQSISKDPNNKSFEIWVVDNGSHDSSLSMLFEQFSHVQVISNEKNLGFSKACNQAILQAKGEFVLLLNPDTIATDTAISKLHQFMLAHPDCGAAGPKVLNPDGTLQLACRRAFPSLSAAFFRITYLSRLFPGSKTLARYNMSYADPNKQLPVDALSGSAMMVRRQTIDQIGLLDEDIFMFGEDIDWCWRIKQAGWTVYYVPEAIVYHIHGAASRLRPIGVTIDLHKGMEVFYRKHLAPKYWSPINAFVYAAIWCRACFFMVINCIRSVCAPQNSHITLAMSENQLNTKK